MINCTFIGNSAGDHGGAIVYSSPTNCTFIDNFAANDAGAIYSTNIVYNCNFTNCYSINASGGAISGANLINYCNFYNCYCANMGGAIRWNGYQGVVNNTNFIECSAEKGGAIYWTGNEGNVLNSNFKNCAANNGGAVYAVTATNCSFVNNTANEKGGACYQGSANNCTFDDNTASEGKNWYRTNVPKLNLNVGNFNSTYGLGDAIFMNATDNGGAAVNNVIITIRVSKNSTSVGNYSSLTNQNWPVDLDVGIYTAVMTVEHNSFELNPVTVTLTINKILTNISALDVITTYNGNDYMAVSLKDINGNPLAGMPISIDLNGIKNFTTDNNGQINVSTNGLLPGNYTATVTFDGSNYNYNTSSATANVSVMKATPAISSAAVTTVYNGGKYLIVTLKDAEGKAISGASISVDLKGAKAVQTDKNGQAKFTTNALTPKTYTVKINFAGDERYLAVSTSAKVTVKKATPKLTASKKTFKKSVKTKKYTVTLKDNNKKVMKKTKVTLKVKGKTYTAKTNSKGKATFKITNLKKKCKVTAKVTYKGNANYNKVTKSVKITVK